jgi:DNA-binding IclR family transcriptional regulator
LLCFSPEQPALTLTQLAERMALSKSTVHRLLTTLETRRFVSRDRATGAYHLGYRLMEMATTVLQEAGRHDWAFPYLQRLAEECGETVDLSVLDGPDVVYLQVVESSQRVKIAAAVGQRLPAHCTASGKAFMAYLSEDHVRPILAAGMAGYTQQTRLDIADVFDDLRSTFERGFAISREEYEQDIHAVAAPILDATGYPVAVVAIVGPSYRLPLGRMSELGRMVQSTTTAIRRDIGPTVLQTLLRRAYI